MSNDEQPSISGRQALTRRRSVAAGALALAGAVNAGAAPPASQQPHLSYTLEQAVAVALAKHPRLAKARAEETASAARTDAARITGLPNVGVSAQLNRSTGNTVPGAFFPTQGFPPIAGAPRGRSLDSGVWQTGASLWANWDALSPIRDAAEVDVALAREHQAAALTSAERLEIAYRAADAFLLAVEAQETLRAADANRERARTLVTAVKPLVDQNLRPGVELARAEAELASAETLVARADQAREVRRAELGQALGIPGADVEPLPDGLTGPLDDSKPITTASPERHPKVVASNAAVERTEREEQAVDLSYLPRVDLAAALWLRGSGYYNSPGDGIVPDVPNWAAGATITWNFLELPSIRARSRAAAAERSVAAAGHDEAYLAVASELSSASAVLKGTIAVSKQTPAALKAAQAAEQQANARYRTGLVSVVDVAEADRLLAEAEIDDAVARLEVRRALLMLARASGDLGPFFRSRGGR